MSAVVLAHRPRTRRTPAGRRPAYAASWSTEGSSALASYGEARRETADSTLSPVELRPPGQRLLSDRAPMTLAPSTRPVAAQSARGLRLTRRGRLAVTVSATVAALALSLTLVPMVAAGVASAFGSTPVSTTTVVVEPGQSLWEVAESAAPGSDTASAVARIADANGITHAGELRPGQRLVVPLG